ncbi:PspC domain-containing protein [Ornithinimicrobium sp. F0845]|uniref:PspC domain-containing protein n=1 Tax=Ornithinimicrobium sp. F0845 TaxID=2926412 RepID=UPI001FF3448D|nr:PspC domain-containing protein [Ornithinimicrobium sp. F0845]MCK0110625.1 PspC domain-containing protein [Ornithinimicrobium sp. F0845]
MTQTPPGGQYGGQPGPRSADNFFVGLRRIDMRRSGDSWFGGVCSGLAERLGIDPIVVRALFVVLSLGLGAGVLLYLAGWLLIPDRDETTHIEQALRNGEVGSVILLVFTVLSVFGTFGWWGNDWWFGGLWTVISLTLLALGGWWLWTEWSRREQPGFYSNRAAQSGASQAGPAQSGPVQPDPAQSGSAQPWGSPSGTTQAWSSQAWSSQHPAPPYAGQDTASVSTTQDRPEDALGSTAPIAGSSGATAWSPTEPSVGQSLGQSGDHQGGGPTPATPRPPKPPKAPRRPSRRSAGVAGTLLGTGLALAAGGGLAWAATEYDWPVDPVVIGLTGALAALGLVILLLGLLGRTSGFPGFLAVCALILTMVAVPVGHNFVPSGRMGDVTWRPDASIGDDGPFRLGAGTGTLDLRGVDPGDFPDPIVASVSFGNLTVVVPDDLTVRIEAGAGMGAVNKNGQDVGGIGVDEVIVVGDGPVDVEVEANVGFGQVLVEERG